MAQKKQQQPETTVKLRNIANQTLSEVPLSVWERNKRKWKGVFEVLPAVKVPPEVKELQEKKEQAGSKAGGKKANQQKAAEPKADEVKTDAGTGEKTAVNQSPQNDTTATT